MDMLLRKWPARNPDVGCISWNFTFACVDPILVFSDLVCRLHAAARRLVRWTTWVDPPLLRSLTLVVLGRERDLDYCLARRDEKLFEICCPPSCSVTLSAAASAGPGL